MQVFPPYLFYFSEFWSIRVHMPGDEKHRVLETVSVVLYLHSQYPNLTVPANWNNLISHLRLTSVFHS